MPDQHGSFVRLPDHGPLRATTHALSKVWWETASLNTTAAPLRTEAPHTAKRILRRDAVGTFNQDREASCVCVLVPRQPAIGSPILSPSNAQQPQHTARPPCSRPH